MSPADNICKQFRPIPGLMPDIDPNCLDADGIIEEETHTHNQFCNKKKERRGKMSLLPHFSQVLEYSLKLKESAMIGCFRTRQSQTQNKAQ